MLVKLHYVLRTLGFQQSPGLARSLLTASVGRSGLHAGQPGSL
jgi:hypothetical protein